MPGPVNVTRAFLPPREEYLAWLDKACASHVLTNNGPIHRELEEILRTRFEVPHLRLMANGTLAIQLAIRALELTGEVITSPYSYVATTSALLWEGCTPIFVDIDPRSCCIDPALIESAITPRTTAIMATHVYGIPCDVEAIAAIAAHHGLKVIYDAAHAFDVSYKGRSILHWGDASTLSFHATKLFHTVEGGAVVTTHATIDQRIRLMRSFGHIGDEHFTLGINAKMSEVHAAMGLAILPHMGAIMKERQQLCVLYRERLGPDLALPVPPAEVVYNHSYFPILLPDGRTRQKVFDALAAEEVHARRYFHPSLDTLPYVRSTACPQSNATSERVLCLPLYNGLPLAEVDRIAGIILTCLKRA